MSSINKKDMIKLRDGVEKTDIVQMEEYLDEEIETFTQKLDQAQAKSLGQMKIKMVVDEILPLPSDEPGVGAILLVGICKFDDNYYGAFFNPKSLKQYVEELIIKGVPKGNETVIQGTRMIKDGTEWHVVAEFFIQENIFEMNRIVNWAFQANSGDFKSAVKSAKKMEWLKKVNTNLKGKHKKPITAEEAALLAVRSQQWPLTNSPMFRSK